VNPSHLLDLWRGAIVEVALVAAPFLVTALVVGVAIALLQTATQLQEATLSFVPKLCAAILVLALGGHLLLDRLTGFTRTAIAAAADTHEPSP
jgi:flagellar biosynthesis protein FliQ